jgi:sugar-specific transcriptional regulator TrmB
VQKKVTTPSDAAISQDARKVLRELGLTDYETRAYLALLGGGALSASEISENAHVPYSKIYETLASLESKGWVESQRGRPTRYYPKAPSETLANMKLQLEDKVKKWEKTVLDELEPFYEHREIREKPDIWILRGEFNTLAKLKEMIDKTKNELMIAAPFMSQTLADSATRIFQQLSPSVKVQIMVAGKAKEWNLEKLRGFADVRVRDHMFGGGAISDGKEAMLFLGEEKPTLVIWSNHIGLVQFAKEYFRYLWESSKKVDSND